MKTLLIIILTSLSSLAANVDISQHLLNREKLYTQYFQVMYDLSDIQRQSALNLWVSSVNKSDPGYLKGQTGVYYNLKDVIKNKQLIDLAAHYYYTGDLNATKNVLDFYFHSLATFLFEFYQNPVNAETDFVSAAEGLVQQGLYSSVTQFRGCLDSQLQLLKTNKRDGLIKSKNCVNSNLKNALSLVQNILNDKYYTGPGFVQHYTGFIPGNKVEQLTENPTDPQSILTIGELNQRIKGTVPVGGTKPYAEMSSEDFKTLMSDKSSALNNFFTANEGLPAAHPIYAELNPGLNSKNIFGSIYKSIENAKQSIFIDVFFLGGSMGAHLAKKLVELSQKNPTLYIYILTDRNNPLAYEKELGFVFNYLKAYSEKFEPNRFFVLKPNITLKRTALPPFADLLVDDKSIAGFLDTDLGRMFAAKLGGYPKAKSDHSKVFVIDGLTDSGVAFVGSKNHTDSSGAIATDEVTRVEGPAVKVILDSYYYDLVEAMKINFNSISITDIKKLLAPVDVLQRYNNSSSAFKVIAQAKGSALLQLGENNVYGTIRSPLEQNIHLIKSAKEQIIISDQFLYDPQIIAALKSAVLKNPYLRVYIILAPLDDPLNSLKAFAHVPNNVFLSDLNSLKGANNDPKIQVKWKKVPESKLQALKQVNQKFGENLSPEYHLKSLSIDGVLFQNRNSCRNAPTTSSLPVFISGSANKDNMTMTGGFREFQLLVYDKNASAAHDCAFWSRWDNSQETVVADPNNFILPEKLKAKGVTPEEFLFTIKTLLLYAYNFTENFF